jgi:hypothetical protein
VRKYSWKAARQAMLFPFSSAAIGKPVQAIVADPGISSEVRQKQHVEDILAPPAVGTVAAAPGTAGIRHIRSSCVLTIGPTLKGERPSPKPVGCLFDGENR